MSARVATSADRRLRDYLYASGPSFMFKLFDAIFSADSTNLEQLARAFPDEVAAVRAYRTIPGYSDFIRSLS
ncbi:MAG: hypothetical protein WA045_11785 [Nitrospira sp.]